MNIQLLEAVKDVLVAELENATGQYHQMMAGYNDVSGETLAELFNQLRGAFSMLSMSDAETLSTEIVAVLSDWDAICEKHESAPQKVSEAANNLNRYFVHTAQMGDRTPLLLATEINAMRSLQGKKALDDSIFLVSYLPVEPFVSSVMEKTDQQRQALQRARQLYQKGLLSLIRGQSPLAAIRVMTHSVTLLSRGFPAGSRELTYWQLASTVLHAMTMGQLKVSKSRLRALMMLERQMAILLKSEGGDYQKCYPLILQRSLLSSLMLINNVSEKGQQLACELGVDTSLFSDREIQATRALFTGGSDRSFHDSLSVLDEQLRDLRTLLDSAPAFADKTDSELEIVTPLLSGIADICNTLGLTLAEERFRLLLNENEKASEQFVQSVADAVLYLECVLLQVGEDTPTEQQLREINSFSVEEMVEKNMLLHAEKLVLQESVVALGSVMQAVTDYFDGVAGSDILAEQCEKFNAISGATRMLQLERAALVADGCRTLFTDGLENTAVSRGALLETLADAVVSLEFYLDNRSRFQQADDEVLAIAEDCLQLLC